MAIREKLKEEWERESERLRRAADPQRKASLQQTALRLLVRFFTFMLVCTILSRAADGMTVAKVETEKVSDGTLTYKISVDGTVESVSRLPVSAPGGLLVQSLPVKKGDAVKKGDTLAVFDQDTARALLEKAETDLASLRGEAEKTVKTGGLDRREAEKAVQNAEEDLRLAEDAARENRDRAEEKRAQAETAYQKAAQRLESDIRKICADQQKEAQAAYDGALAALERERTAYNKARMEEDRKVGDAKDALEGAQDSDDDDAVAEAKKVLRRVQEDRDLALKQQQQMLEEARRKETAAKDVLFETQTQDAQNQVRETEQKKVDEAREALRSAGEDLQTARRDGENLVKAARRALEEARGAGEKAAADSAAAAAARKASSHAIRQKEREAEALRSLRDAGYVLTAPADGTVENVAVREGEKTTEGASVTLTTDTEGFRFVGNVSRREAERLSTGDAGRLTFTTGGESVAANAEITEISTPDGEGKCAVKAALPEGVFRAGQSAALEIANESGRFPACLPLTALRSGTGGDYVLILREKDSVLGKQDTAARVPVKVLDQDGSRMAVEGALLPQDEVISGSSKNISEGDRVRPAQP